MRLTFKELKDEISKIVPKSIDYKVDLEAGNIAIVTNEPEKFGGGDGLVGKIAKKIKRKIKVRPDPSIVKSEQDAKSIIESIIPAEAEISQIYFDSCFSEVIIQCKNPGEAVGRRGANVNEISTTMVFCVAVFLSLSHRCLPILGEFFGIFLTHVFFLG